MSLSFLILLSACKLFRIHHREYSRVRKGAPGCISVGGKEGHDDSHGNGQRPRDVPSAPVAAGPAVRMKKVLLKYEGQGRNRPCPRYPTGFHRVPRSRSPIAPRADDHSPANTYDPALDLNSAFRNSRLSRAMNFTLIPLGHAASHS